MLRQEDGSYEWDGDDENYGDDWLLTQRYWDFEKYKTDREESYSQNDRLYFKENRAAHAMTFESRDPWSLGSFVDFMTYFDGYWDAIGIISAGMNYTYYQSNSNWTPYTYIIELPGDVSQQTIDAVVSNIKDDLPSSAQFRNNAILNNWRKLDASYWPEMTAPNADENRRWDFRASISENFWGGASDELIKMVITDFSDTFDKAKFNFLPKLDVAPQSAYPFVVKAEVLDADGNRPAADDLEPKHPSGVLLSIEIWIQLNNH